MIVVPGPSHAFHPATVLSTRCSPQQLAHMSSPNTRDDDQGSDSNGAEGHREAQPGYEDIAGPAANAAPIPQYMPQATYLPLYPSQAAPLPQTYPQQQAYQPQQIYHPLPAYTSMPAFHQQSTGGQQLQQHMWGQRSAPQAQPPADSIAFSPSYYGYGTAIPSPSSAFYGPSTTGPFGRSMPDSMTSPMPQPLPGHYHPQGNLSSGALGPAPFRGYQTNIAPNAHQQQSTMYYSGQGLLPRIAVDEDPRGYRRIPVSFLLNDGERTQPLPLSVQTSQPQAQSSPDVSGGTRGSTGDDNKKKMPLPPISSIKKMGHGLESASFTSPTVHPSRKDSAGEVRLGRGEAMAAGNRSETSGPTRQPVGPGSSSADTGPVRKRWSPQEDEIVVQGVIDLRTWDEIAAMLPTGRTASQVRLRYQNYLQFSNIARRSHFTKQEDDQILTMASKKRRKWSELAKTMGRSHVSVKNRMYFLTRERKNSGKGQRAPSPDSAGNPMSGSGKDGSDEDPLSDNTGDDELGDDEEESQGEHERDDKTQAKGSKSDKPQDP